MLADDVPPWLHLTFAFVLGATWGSFFNVAIYRWPREMSVVSPPSHCPACGAGVPGYRNVPILAYLWQRGRAACCGAPMTPRYVVVEALSGVLALALAQRCLVHAPEGATLAEAGLTAASWFVFVGGLVIATFVDLEWMEIPDEVSIGGTALGLATIALRPGADALEMALGAGAGFLAVQLVLVWLWERWTGRRGMGEGDAKFVMFIGTFLGWKGALFAVVAGALQGLVAVAVAALSGRSLVSRAPIDAPVPGDAAAPSEAANEQAPSGPAPDQAPSEGANEPAPNDAATSDAATDEGPPRIPFGPFLALAALEYLFFGDAILDWYVALLMG